MPRIDFPRRLPDVYRRWLLAAAVLGKTLGATVERQGYYLMMMTEFPVVVGSNGCIYDVTIATACGQLCW